MLGRYDFGLMCFGALCLGVATPPLLCAEVMPPPLPAVIPIDPLSARAFNPVRSTISRYCVDCHSSEEPEGHFNLEQFANVDDVLEHPGYWEKAFRRVRAGEMPPPKSETLPFDERDVLLDWIHNMQRALACRDGISPGPAPIRRLNRTEYSITIRDLLGIHFDAGHALPADGAGGAGFDNAAETLFLSPVHAEKYLEAAKQALDYSSKDSRSRKRLFIARPDDQTPPREAARRVLERLTERAFRRPVSAEEIERLLTLFDQATERGDTFEAAAYYAMQAVLVSPHFLFRIEQIPDTADAQPVNDYELATRLSYFLWSSMPDDQLFDLAGQGKLQDPQVLADQTLRMLKDDKARGLAENFIGQWLGTRELGTKYAPDAEQFGRYGDEIESAMREEPIRLFQEILKENHSLLDLIDADYTYVNQRLANFYGIHRDIKQDLNQNPKRVELKPGSHRGGILTMGSVLIISSYPDRTSPVLRGKWVLETLLGSAPPPPPPDVPELSTDEKDSAGKTLRERLMIHRENPACASCHDRLDPIGFGLENFDASGRWRTEEAGLPIDASGELPGGVKFNGPEELKQVLLERKDEFIEQVASRMLAYALGRGLVNEDYCTLDRILARVKASNYKAHTLILEIVRSVPFRYRPGAAAEPEVGS